jgi:hypothetical protein
MSPMTGLGLRLKLENPISNTGPLLSPHLAKGISTAEQSFAGNYSASGRCRATEAFLELALPEEFQPTEAVLIYAGPESADWVLRPVPCRLQSGFDLAMPMALL